MPRALTTKERNIRARNRANAQASTGPRTEAGKARTALNGLTHGLTAERLPPDEAAARAAERASIASTLAAALGPANAVEHACIAAMAEAWQRLERIDRADAEALEAALARAARTQGACLVHDRRYLRAFSGLERLRAAAAAEFRRGYALFTATRRFSQSQARSGISPCPPKA